MAQEIVMPRLSDSMEEGTVLTWMKSVGEKIAVGDELVEIETDKANMIHEADVGGTLIEIVADEGDTRPIGGVIAWIGEPGEVAPDGSAARAILTETPTTTQPASTATQSSQAPVLHTGSPASSRDRAKASPLARRLANERGIELATLAGSGPANRIVKADVLAALESGSAPTGEVADPLSPDPPSAPSPIQDATVTAKGEVKTIELSKLQQTVSRRMAESKATAPHFYLHAEIDMTRCVSARTRLKAAAAEGDVVPSYNDMVVKASAIALREVPRANGAYRDGRIEEYSRINIGVAVAAENALVVPTIFDADHKGLCQIASESRALAQKVRDASVTPPDLAGGTFTVSNLGMYGISGFNAVINSPQAAILAVGAITEKAVRRDGELAFAHVMGVGLACDHRILYGADGAKFLARVRALLEEPVGLAL